MESEATRRVFPGGTVMASIDPDVGGDRFIIADVTRDDAWLAVSRSDAIDIEQWR